MKELKGLFEKLSYGRSTSTVFNEILDYTIGIMTCKCDPEFTLQSTSDIKETGRIELLAAFLRELGKQCEGFEDPLGEIFMEYISMGRNGQYFTPMNICKLMTSITMTEDVKGKTVSDPTCGSGRMFLAAAATDRSLFFHGSDIDLTCCKMATLNLLLNSLSGRIYWGNPLTNEYHFVFIIGISSFKLPYVQILKCDNSGLEEKCAIPLRTGEQLTLF